VDGITAALTLFMSVEVVIALVAAAYIVSVYRPVRGQAPFFDRLAVRDAAAAMAGAVIGAVAIYSLLRYIQPEWGLAPLIQPVPAILVGVPIVVLLYGPIADAIAIWRSRRAPRD
jgi:multisubunit Na+/H+ antiporter MnhF subunit